VFREQTNDHSLRITLRLRIAIHHSFQENEISIILLRKLGARPVFLNRYRQPLLPRLTVTFPDSSLTLTTNRFVCEGTFLSDSSRLPGRYSTAFRESFCPNQRYLRCSIASHWVTTESGCSKSRWVRERMTSRQLKMVDLIGHSIHLNWCRSMTCSSSF
jgi:hypothetical protein